MDGLSIVAGAVLLQPGVTGGPVERGQIGRRPVGQTSRTLTLNATWQTLLEGPALTLGANHRGVRIADQLNLAEAPAATRVDAGFRYRFDIGATPALLRFQVTNVGDTFDWRIVGSGTFEVNAPRTASLFLTLDF
jgi:iron complex outermembrane receptor protein